MAALHRLAPLAAVAWLLVITAMAGSAAWGHWLQLQALALDRPWQVETLRYALATVGGAAALTTIAGLLAPAWWRRIFFILAILPVPLLLFTSGNVAAGCTAVAVLVPALWLGREAARQARLPDALDTWLVGGALGIGGLALLGYVLGSFGWLRPEVIWPVLFVVTAALLLAKPSRKRLAGDAMLCRDWLGRPIRRRPDIFLAAGLVVGVFWLNLVGALAPEITSDAVRQRLAAADFWAREGRLTATPELVVTASPHLGEITYATLLASGPLQTAKIADCLIGVLCAAGVWGLGRRLGGEWAGLVGALAFYTLPTAVTLSQTAIVDLFATLFGVAAALALAGRGRPGPRAIAAAAVCLGCGVATKTSFLPVALGLALAALAAILPSLRRRGLLVGGVVGGVAVALLVVLWLTRTAVGGPARSPFDLQALARAVGARLTGSRPAALDDYVTYGIGRSLAALLRLPLDLTFRTGRFDQVQDGFAGYLLLALLPLAALTRPSGRFVRLAAAAGIAILGWFAIAQYLRYLLPACAILCALGGAACAAAVRPGVVRWVSGPLLVALAGLGLVSYLHTVMIYPRDLPYQVVLGRQDKETYLEYYVPQYGVLRLLNSEPRATRAVAASDYSRLYASIPLTVAAGTVAGYTLDPADIADSEGGLLRYLDRGGYSHILIDRGAMPPNWESMLVLDEDFLRRNTVLVGHDRNTYLYRLVPPDERGRDQGWAQGSNLLYNGGFEVGRGDRPVGWAPEGHPAYDSTGVESYDGRGAVRVAQGEAFSATVGVTPDRPYLLSHRTRGVTGYAQSRLQINWLDGDGRGVGVSLETAPASPQGYHRFSMLATAPARATAARVYAQAQWGDVWFDDISLQPLAPDARTAGDIELLGDTGFDALLVGRGSPWHGYRNGGDDGAGVARSPETVGAAVFARPESGYWQSVRVVPGRDYRLGYIAWSEQWAQARLQINWSDGGGKFLSTSIQVVEVGEHPSTYDAWMTAPPGAASGEVYVSVQEGGPVWFDDFTLRERASGGAPTPDSRRASMPVDAPQTVTIGAAVFALPLPVFPPTAGEDPQRRARRGLL